MWIDTYGHGDFLIFGIGLTPDDAHNDAGFRAVDTCYDGPISALYPCDERLYRLLEAEPPDQDIDSIPWRLDERGLAVFIDDAPDRPDEADTAD